MEEPLERLEDILGVSTIMARSKLRAHPDLRSVGVEVRGILRFRRRDVVRILRRDTANASGRKSGARKSALHPLVAPIEKSLATTVENDRKHRIEFRTVSSAGVEVVVTDKLRARAVAFLDAFVKHADSNDIAFAGDSTNSHRAVGWRWMVVDGENFTFKLRERMIQSRHRLTAREQAYAKDHPGWSPYEKWDFTPSGELYIEFDGRGYFGHRMRWNDTSRRPIDEAIPEMLASLKDKAGEIKARRAELEREARDRALSAERAEQDRRRREEEQRRRDELLSDLRDWSQSQELRRFIEAARLRAEQLHGEIQPDSHIARWIAWATAVADDLDPLSPPNQS